MTHIKDLRIAHGFTQQHMSSVLGITRGAYANIENEKREPDIAALILLADYFDVTVDYLIGHEKESTAKDDGLTKQEHTLLAAYRAASPDDRAIIDNIINRYTQGGEATRLA